MGKNADSFIDKERDYGEEGASYYDSTELDDYEPDAINHPENTPEAYYVQDYTRHEC